MDVFIGNLPPSATLEEIREIHGNWRFNAVIRRVDGQDKSGRLYRYFLVHFAVDDEKAAQQLIKQLHGLSYYGRKIEVRPFIHRSYCNERRALDWREKPWHAEERRLGERRIGHH